MVQNDLNMEGKSQLGSDQQEEYYNRDEPPSLFECGVHGHTDHVAEGFVVFGTVEGQECIPVCLSGAVSVIMELSGAHGIRYVDQEIAATARGKILGKLSNS